MKLFIANLPHKLEEGEIKTMLTQFGQVSSVKLKTDESGKRKGWGFIEMPVEAQAKAAVAALNGKEIHGRKIALSESEEKKRENSGGFQRPRRQYRDHGNAQQEEIDGNKW